MSTAMVAWPSWLLGSTVGATRVTLPSSRVAPMIRILAGCPTFSLGRSRVGTRPIRSNSLRAMMVNSGSPLAEATAPIAAVEAEISPATGACTCTTPPSGSASRASVCPGVTVSPASARMSVTLSPCRSGRTNVSSRGRTMPATSAIASKQDFAAFSTETAAPLRAASPASSAARAGCEAPQNRVAARRRGSRREGLRARWVGHRDPISLMGLSIAEGQAAGQA